MKICYKNSVPLIDWIRFFRQFFVLCIIKLLYRPPPSSNLYKVNLHNCTHKIIEGKHWNLVISQDIDLGRVYYTYDYCSCVNFKGTCLHNNLHLGFDVSAYLLKEIVEKATTVSSKKDGCTCYMLDLDSVPKKEIVKGYGATFELLKKSNRI